MFHRNCFRLKKCGDKKKEGNKRKENRRDKFIAVINQSEETTRINSWCTFFLISASSLCSPNSSSAIYGCGGGVHSALTANQEGAVCTNRTGSFAAVSDYLRDLQSMCNTMGICWGFNWICAHPWKSELPCSCRSSRMRMCLCSGIFLALVRQYTGCHLFSRRERPHWYTENPCASNSLEHGKIVRSAKAWVNRFFVA